MSHLDPIHHHLIVSLLLAAEVQARVVSNAEYTGVEIRTEPDGRIIWANTGDYWVYSQVTAEGEVIGGSTEVDADAEPEDVFLMMMNTPLGEPQ